MCRRFREWWRRKIPRRACQKHLIGIAKAESKCISAEQRVYPTFDLAIERHHDIARRPRRFIHIRAELLSIGFTVTALYTAAAVEMPKGVAPPHGPDVYDDQHDGDAQGYLVGRALWPVRFFELVVATICAELLSLT